MKIPEVRFTVRRAMVAVAVIALGLGLPIELMRRRERLLTISLDHVGPAAMEGTLIITDEGPAYAGIASEKGRWHEAMRRKYDYYGHRPWLPIPSDPPEPK